MVGFLATVIGLVIPRISYNFLFCKLFRKSGRILVEIGTRWSPKKGIISIANRVPLPLAFRYHPSSDMNEILLKSVKSQAIQGVVGWCNGAG